MVLAAHNRTHFFKYTSASTAVAILKTGSVRYSSPILFNDPFDVQSGLHYSFDIEALPGRLLERIEELVMQVDEPLFPDPHGDWPKNISLMRSKRATHGFPEALRHAMLERFDRMKGEFSKHHKEWQDSWLEMLPRMRVFSIAEDHDNLLMWAHYAADHTGVVFELAVLPDEDNALCVAEPVIYSATAPSPFSSQELIDSIVGLRELRLDSLCMNYARVKGNCWRYEKEWRVWDLVPHRVDPLFTSYSLRPNEIRSVFLGCRMTPEVHHAIEGLMTKYPVAKVYEARKRTDAFALEFARLN